MMDASGEFSIGEVARHTGVAASTLRYWERAMLVDAPRRVGGKRRYNTADLRRIEMITLSKRAGFTLAEIRILLDGISEKRPPPKIWRELAKGKLPEIIQTLTETAAMKAILETGLSCECLSLEQCLDHFESTGAKPLMMRKR